MRRLAHSNLAWGSALVVLAGSGGALVAVSPLPAFAPFLAAAGIYTLSRAAGRLLFFVGGATFVFASGAGLNAPKLAFLAGVAVSVIVALTRLPQILATEWGARFKPALWGAMLIAAWVVTVSLPKAVIVDQTPLTPWARDASTYLLISAGIIIALDAASTISRRHVIWLTSGFGLVAAYGFASFWLDRRQTVGGEEVAAVQATVLASMVAIVVPFALALVLSLCGRRIRWLGLLLAVALACAVLITGTRTGLVFLLVFLGLMGVPEKARIPFRRIFLGVVPLGLVAAYVLPVIAAQVMRPGLLEKRIGLAVEALQGGFSNDASGAIRLMAYLYTSDIFSDNLFFGQGVGRTFPNPNPGGVRENFTLDTPLVYPAKFGILGCIVLLGAMVLIFRALVKAPGRTPLPERTAVWGTIAVLIGLMPFGAPTEDKGFMVAVALLVALVATAMRTATLTPDDDVETAKTAGVGLPAAARGLVGGRPHSPE